MTLTKPIWGQFVITRQALLGPTRAQNLTILSLAIPEKFKGCKILKWITWPRLRLFQGRFVTDRLGHAIINLPTKFEVPVFTRYENMKGLTKCRKWGGLGQLGVTQGHWK